MKISLILGAALALLVAPAALAQVAVTGLTVLPKFSSGSNSDFVSDINSSGQITGYGTTSGGKQHAFLFSNSQYTDLGTIGSNSAGSQGISINDSGQIAGQYYPGQNSITRPFVYSGGTMTDIGLLGGPQGAAYGAASGINNSGVAVGGSTLNAGNVHAVVWSNGVMTDIGTLGGTNSAALAISNTGYVVGYSWLHGDNGRHAFIYSNGTMTDLGALASSADSRALAVNDAGQAVGYSVVGNQNHATLWSNGTVTDLGAFSSFGSQAVGINDSGFIIGTTTNGLPFLSFNGTAYDLNTLAYSFLTGATGTTEGFYQIENVAAINDSNEIVGDGLYYDGNGNFVGRSFVLTVSVAAVPEPATWAVVLGVVGLALAAWRRRVRHAA